MRTHDGLDLHVSVHGPDDAPVTVALSHCWTADEADWHYQVRDLMSHYGHAVRILTWDHRGHGKSARAPERDCTIHNLARDMGTVLDTHAPHGRLVIGGHSVGGMAVMALPEERPDLVDRIEGLLFVATSSGRLHTVTLGLPDTGKLVKAQIPRILALRARTYSRAHRRRSPTIERQVVGRLLFGTPLRQRDCGLVVDQLINCPPETMSGFFRDLMEHERTEGLDAYDGIPTTVMVGSADRLTPVRHARRLATAIRGGRLVVCPDAGHMLTLERDRLVSDELIHLIDGALAKASSDERAGAHRAG